MRTFLSIFLVCFFWLTMQQAVADETELVWQVEQPFRFLKFPSDQLIHEMARADINDLSEAKDTPISLMQTKLADERWWAGRIDKSVLARLAPDLSLDADSYTRLSAYSAARSKEREQHSRKIGPLRVRSGWSSLAQEQADGGISNAACWDSDQQVYRGCVSDAGGIKGANEYILPVRHIVRLQLKGSDAKGKCTYRILSGSPRIGSNQFGLLSGKDISSSDVLQQLAVDDCSKPIRAQIAYGDRYELEVSHSSGERFDAVVEVQDKLVVSIGDSFASGEGNPDVPVKLYEDDAIVPYTNTKGNRDYQYGLPYRSKKSGSYARWLDTRCHRSMYAPPTRAAIALAMVEPRHHAITYVTYACSGAQITSGLFWPQDGVECSKQSTGDNRERFLEPQISAVVNALATGGRFADYDGPGLASKDRYLDGELADGERMLRLQPKARARANFDDGRCRAWPGYQSMKEAPTLWRSSFVRKIDALWLSIGGNDAGFAEVAARAVLSPDFSESKTINEITYRLAKQLLTTKGEELDERWTRDLPKRLDLLVAGLRDKLEVEPSKTLWVSYPSPFTDRKGKQCKPSKDGANVTFLTAYRKANPERDEGGIEEAVEFFESLDATLEARARAKKYVWVNSHEDKFREHGLCSVEDSSKEQLDLPHMNLETGEWENGFRPRDLRPYDNYTRYFRTLNDTYTLIHHSKRDREDPPKPNFLGIGDKIAMARHMATRAINGAFHVNAQGNAHTADAIYCASLPVLFDTVSEKKAYENAFCASR